MAEAKERTTPQEFLNWLTFWELNPPIRKYINLAQANICHTIAAVAPCCKGQRAPEFKKFLFDFERAAMSQNEKVVANVKRIFGK